MSTLDKVSQDIQDALLSMISDQFLYKLGTLARELIRKRTASGYGVDSDDKTGNATKVKLAPLSDDYISFRQRLNKAKSRKGKAAKKIQLGEFFSARRSNATLTGQMLGSFGHKIINAGINLYILDTRRNDGKLTNRQVAEYYSEDREFFALTEDEVRVLQREIEKELREKILRLSRRA